MMGRIKDTIYRSCRHTYSLIPKNPSNSSSVILYNRNILNYNNSNQLTYYNRDNINNKSLTRFSYSKHLYNDDNNSNKSEKNGKINKDLLFRKANLGTIIEMLQMKVPDLLTDLLPNDFISDQIILRILPNQFPNLPIFKGYLLYSSTLKTIQKILLMFYLNPQSKIHISNIKIIEPTNSLSSDELINLSINNNSIESIDNNNNNNNNNSDTIINHQDSSKFTTKIKISWRTCYPGCDDLCNTETTEAKLGSYSLDHFDWTKFLKSQNPLNSLNLLEAKVSIKNLAKSFDDSINNNKNDNNTNTNLNANEISSNSKFRGRILTGVFVFELDAKNEHIIVFTIDNMEILENRQTDYVNGCFA